MNLTSPKIDELPSFSPRLKLGVLASGNGSNFENLLSSKLDADIELLIVNNPTAKVIERAKRLNTNFIILNNRDYANRDDYEKEIINCFNRYKVEGIVMAGWDRVVTSRLISTYKERIVNIHPSLLPSFKGMNAVERALESNVKITGCTVHLVALEVDAGPILIQSAVPILNNDDVEILLSRIQEEEHLILPFGVALAAKQWRKNNLWIEAS